MSSLMPGRVRGLSPQPWPPLPGPPAARNSDTLIAGPPRGVDADRAAIAPPGRPANAGPAALPPPPASPSVPSGLLAFVGGQQAAPLSPLERAQASIAGQRAALGAGAPQPGAAGFADGVPPGQSARAWNDAHRFTPAPPMGFQGGRLGGSLGTAPRGAAPPPGPAPTGYGAIKPGIGGLPPPPGPPPAGPLVNTGPRMPGQTGWARPTAADARPLTRDELAALQRRPRAY